VQHDQLRDGLLHHGLFHIDGWDVQLNNIRTNHML